MKYAGFVGWISVLGVCLSASAWAWPQFPELGTSFDLKIEDETWIDGEAIRYWLESAKASGGEKISQVLDRIQGARVIRGSEDLKIGLYFSESFVVKIRDEDEAENWQPYSVEVPKSLRFSLNMNDGVLRGRGFDEGQEKLDIKVKIPFAPDRVYLRNFSADLSTGDVELEAGVLGNLLAVVAKGHLIAKKFDGVDIWESLLRSFHFSEAKT
jgi:hypothetical protein